VLLDFVDIVVHIQHSEEPRVLRPGPALEGLPRIDFPEARVDRWPTRGGRYPG